MSSRFSHHTHKRVRGKWVTRMPSRQNANKQYVIRKIAAATEIKSFDSEIVSTQIPTVGLIFPFANVTQGTTVNQRNGNKINATSLVLREEIAMNVLATQQIVRRIIFQDKQQIADVHPAVSDVLNLAGGADWLSQYSLISKGRFKILSDRYYTFSSTGGKTLSATTKVIMFKNALTIRYNGGAGGDIQKNGLFVLYTSNDDANSPGVIWQSRLNFRD